jgi:hypothetical protein
VLVCLYIDIASQQKIAKSANLGAYSSASLIQTKGGKLALLETIGAPDSDDWWASLSATASKLSSISSSGFAVRLFINMAAAFDSPIALTQWLACGSGP